MIGKFFLSIFNYPWYTPICTTWCAAYYSEETGQWQYTPWGSVFNAQEIECELNNVRLVIWVGNHDALCNHPGNDNGACPRYYPASGEISVTTGLVAGGHYRVNLNARDVSDPNNGNGNPVFETGDWEPGPTPPAPVKGGMSVAMALVLVGAMAAVALVIRNAGK